MFERTRTPLELRISTAVDASVPTTCHIRATTFDLGPGFRGVPRTRRGPPHCVRNLDSERRASTVGGWS